MSDIVLDLEREERCGIEEAIFCEGKTAQQISEIVHLALEAKRSLLFTRLDIGKFENLTASASSVLTYDESGRIATLNRQSLSDFNFENYDVAIVSGGASDHFICKEIEVTLMYYGVTCRRFEDVGVSALWRLSNRLNEIKQSKIIISVAGMEAALPTVLSGMLAHPIIAVPTSVGYGVSKGGNLALNSCLGSCAAGLMTVNIDNGFGAACAAIKILRQFEKSTSHKL